ncbi:MAG: hypothetical protein KAW45_00775 [Thermoplasmatales archaeon]|nr:hypothetical protein [Thermoplasmatales archaeon]
MKKQYALIGIIVIAIILIGVTTFLILQNQECVNCIDYSSGFCVGDTLEDCDGKKVSLIGVINSVPAGKNYGYDMSDGVEWNDKILPGVIVSIDTTKLTVPLGKKIQVIGTVQAMKYIEEDDGLQHLIDHEGRAYDPTVIVAEEIRELTEDEITIDEIVGEELADKLGENITINGTIQRLKGFQLDAEYNNSNLLINLFTENDTMFYSDPPTGTNVTIHGRIEKEIWSYGECLEYDVRQRCGDYLVYGINVENIELS